MEILKQLSVRFNPKFPHFLKEDNPGKLSPESYVKNLQLKELKLSFGEREILKDVQFNMNEKTRACLCGANGSGKTTLLKALSGRITPDSISLSITKGCRFSYLEQADVVLEDKDIYSIAEEGYSRFSSLLKELEEEGLKAEKGGDESIRAAERISEIHDTLLDSGYYDRKSRIETILQGLGFTQNDFSRPSREFSGGYQMRAALARILVENPDFLFLDEPTNYLDIEALTWLEGYLKSFSGGLMIVSHDQEFLDDLVNEVYELFSGRLTRYSGNYSKYLETREMEIETLKKKAEKQQEEIERTEEFIERFRYKATKARQVQSRVKMLDKIDIIEVPGHLRKLHFTFPDCPHSANEVLKVDNLSKSFGDNHIYTNFSFLVKKGERLAITGRNGKGKSTLLRILAGVDDAYTGTVREGNGVIKGYFAQDTEKTLCDSNNLIEELETVATTSDQPRLRNLLGCFLFSDDDVFKKVKVLSGGEKSRLALLKILIHPSNLLLLDEPTNHLDISSKDMLLEAIKNYEGTVVFVSHDKHFIKNLATRILYISDEGPIFFDGDWDYFERKLEEKEAQWAVKRENEKSSVPTKAPSSYTEEKAKKNKINSLSRELDGITSKIEKLEEEIRELEEESGKAEVYSVASKIRAVLEEKERKEQEKEQLEEEWLQKEEEREELING